MFWKHSVWKHATLSAMLSGMTGGVLTLLQRTGLRIMDPYRREDFS